MDETSGHVCVDQIAALTTQRNLDDRLRYLPSNFSLAINGFPPNNDCCKAHTVSSGFPHVKDASCPSMTATIAQPSSTAKTHSVKEKAIREKNKGESLESYKTIFFGSKPRSPVGGSKKYLHTKGFFKRVEIKNKPAQSFPRRMSCPGRVSIIDSSGKKHVPSGNETNRTIRPNISVTQEKKNDETGLLPMITEDFEPLESKRLSTLKNSEQGKTSHQIFKTTTESEALITDRETSLTKNISEMNVSFREMSLLPQVRQGVDVGSSKAAIDLQLFGAKSPSLFDTRSIILETKKWIRKNRKSKQKCVDSTTIRSASAEEDSKVKTPEQRNQFEPLSAPLPQDDDMANSVLAVSPTGDISPKDTLERKVEAFLQGDQPQASLRSLKVKSPRNNPASSMGLIERRRDARKTIVNTETCPSLSWINRDRSWYYQDRTGKCRYLRVPESPLPPVEWVFEKS